jgi:mono/diheme cytochrome c family protein
MRKSFFKIAGTLTLMLVFAQAAFPGQKSILPDGKAIFEDKCARCHGRDGTKGLLGAKNLQISHLPDAELLQVVTKGRRIMPAWGKRLSAQELQQVVSYVKQLRH